MKLIIIIIFNMLVTLSLYASDLKTAFEEFDKASLYDEGPVWDAAERGDVDAQYFLAKIFEDDYFRNQTSVKFAKRAALQGHAKAQSLLGFMYIYGNEDVVKDYEEAERWLVRAATQGGVHIQKTLGVLYNQGPIPKNYQKSVYWFRKSAEQGNASAQWHLAKMYEYGNGVTQSVKQAYVWNSVAALSGYYHAIQLQEVLEKQLSLNELAQAKDEAIKLYDKLGNSMSLEITPRKVRSKIVNGGSSKLSNKEDKEPCTCVFNKNRAWNPEKVMWNDHFWKCTSYKDDGTCSAVGIIGDVVE